MDIDLSSLPDQVDTIRTAFRYINRFKGHTFVIRIEGELLDHSFFPLLVKDIVLLKKMGIRIALVPGARKRINELLAAAGIFCPTVGGIRVTPPEAMPYVEMAAFDVSNTIMTLLSEDDCDAIIGNWVKARRLGVLDGTDYQCTGETEKVKVDIIEGLLSGGFIPIFPNIGWSGTGKPYNVSSSELAFAIASALHASKLFFITDFGGISAEGFMIPPGVDITPDNIISQLTAPQAKSFLDLNEKLAKSYQIEIVSMAYRACQAGIERVHVIDGREDGMLLKEIFSNRGLGTMIYADPHENIRGAVHADIPDILKIMRPFVKENVLIPRRREDLETKITDYALYEVDGTLHGCGALHVFPDKSGEIAGIAVDKMYANYGIGKKLVAFLLEKAAGLNLDKIFLLTTHTADWFLELGFAEGTFEDLPLEKKAAYNKARNSLVLMYDLSRKMK
ncbi:MAG TPA: amino-acid N-acetyltransferase [Acidobacteriota bacterium]|nr:amino-acid N-acetyltransferase [Acidobacteriota bacterium]